MTIRHNCETGGCYIKVQTPDWGFSDNAFSKKIRVSDIDGSVEVNGCLLLLEWKGSGVPLTMGQEIMFKKATIKNRGITVFIINGNAETTTVEHLKIICVGEIKEDIDIDNDGLNEKFKEWEAFVNKLEKIECVLEKDKKQSD